MLASMLLRGTQTNTPNLEEWLPNSGNTTNLRSTWMQRYSKLTCHNTVRTDPHRGDRPAPRGPTRTEGTDPHRGDRPAPRGLKHILNFYLQIVILELGGWNQINMKVKDPSHYKTVEAALMTFFKHFINLVFISYKAETSGFSHVQFSS